MAYVDYMSSLSAVRGRPLNLITHSLIHKKNIIMKIHQLKWITKEIWAGSTRHHHFETLGNLKHEGKMCTEEMHLPLSFGCKCLLTFTWIFIYKFGQKYITEPISVYDFDLNLQDRNCSICEWSNLIFSESWLILKICQQTSLVSFTHLSVVKLD